jgi:hypothetical protein
MFQHTFKRIDIGGNVVFPGLVHRAAHPEKGRRVVAPGDSGSTRRFVL